jgi:threonine/homoserine efflux transporter RhtA
METVSIWAAPPAHGTSAPARHFETAFALCLKLSGAATVGMIFLGDAVSTMKLVSIALILAGVAGLNLSGVTS